MQFPEHPWWFWLIVASPFLSMAALWIFLRNTEVSLKRLRPWLWAGAMLLWVSSTILDADSGGKHRTLRAILGASAYTCCGAALPIQRREKFETLRSPNAGWFRGKSAQFSIPSPSVRILVRDPGAVSPWYVERLGLRKLKQEGKTEEVAFKFNADGNSVILTTRAGFQTVKTPMFYSRKIEKMRNVLSSRGVSAGPIERDRQGIRYFQIHDPEGNPIEVVEV